MNRRERLETEVANLRKKIEERLPDTPVELLKSWKQELVALEFELNNLVDGDEDNNY